jgi:hypothetical protein
LLNAVTQIGRVAAVDADDDNRLIGPTVSGAVDQNWFSGVLFVRFQISCSLAEQIRRAADSLTDLLDANIFDKYPVVCYGIVTARLNSREVDHYRRVMRLASVSVKPTDENQSKG